jgi:uncharacterized protein YgbK (DUF1537 family)
MIGVISDDLTGAAELGAVGLRYGLPAEILAGGEPSGKAELVCADTSSRSCPPEEAARRAASVAKQLQACGVRWIYKKVDSVLRGQVMAEVEGVMKELHLDLAVVVPANPLLGRVVRNGRCYVRGKPIDETEFANDPEYPRKSSVILDLLRRPDGIPAQVLASAAKLPASGIVIGEASAPADLQRWASVRNPRTLAGGGAEYFAALLAAEGHKAANPPESQPASAPQPELFICGSASESSCAFASEAQARGTPVISLPETLAQNGDWPAEALEAVITKVKENLRIQSRVILNVGLRVVPNKAVAARLLNALGEVAEQVLRQTKAGRVFAEGGSTAAELVRRMGWKRLKVLKEEGRGVVTLSPEGAGELLLTMKPGSYVWPAKWTG